MNDFVEKYKPKKISYIIVNEKIFIICDEKINTDKKIKNDF
jgi:hypothetical protein